MSNTTSTNTTNTTTATATATISNNTCSSSSSSSSSSSTDEGIIKILPKDVVDRIAAGEVVQRPANAIKELLENALDAGATKITLQVDKQQPTTTQQPAQKAKTNINHKNSNSNNNNNTGRLDFTMSDNGKGIHQADLLVAATRFATSKLTSVNDFSSLSSFGFRGEALASISMVSRLTITSRTHTAQVAYECKYMDGIPMSAATAATASNSNSNSNQSKSTLRKCARTPGTTVKVTDLFYNVPHRQTALNNPSLEYTRILGICKPYAVQVARRGVGLVVQQQTTLSQRKTTTVVDLNTCAFTGKLLSQLQAPQLQTTTGKNSSSSSSNTSNDQQQRMTQAQLVATKQVIAAIYGSHFKEHLLYCHCQNHDSVQTEFKYHCEGFLTAPSLANANHSNINLKHCHTILFVNDRLVQCPLLQRRLEEVYGILTPWKKPPFVWLTLQVPPDQVDVNVHPTKTQVSLLYLEDICQDIVRSVRCLLEEQGKTFHASQSLSTQQEINRKRQIITKSEYSNNNETDGKQQGEHSNNNNNANAQSKRARISHQHHQQQEQEAEPNKKLQIFQLQPPPPLSQFKRKGSTAATLLSSSLSSPSTQTLPYKMVRTHKATPVGALEPFLIRKPSSQQLFASSQVTPVNHCREESSLSNLTSSTRSSNSVATRSPTELGSIQQSPGVQSLVMSESSPVTLQTQTQSQQTLQQNQQPYQNSTHHQPPCPFAISTENQELDMSQPGAFAKASQLCTCRKDQMTQQLTQQQQSAVFLSQQQRQRIVKPVAVVPTHCEFASIHKLRRRIQTRKDAGLQAKLRQAYFVGVVSKQRSLVQWREELCLLNHGCLAQALFYQLALAHFEGNRLAKFAAPVDVQAVIEQVLRLEEDIMDAKVARENSDDDNITKACEGPIMSKVSESSRVMAKQATSCLWEQSEMLEEYFGICFEKSSCSKKVMLVGMPVLLDGHAPSPHGLPLFLLGLATEVDYNEERPCFDGVCRELGNFYGEMPASKDSHGDAVVDASCRAFIQHTLFPAISCLLVPSKSMEGHAKTLTTISNLYKVFERC